MLQKALQDQTIKYIFYLEEQAVQTEESMKLGRQLGKVINRELKGSTGIHKYTVLLLL